MVKMRLSRAFVVLFAVIFIASFVSAAACTISTACKFGENILLELSADSNAHTRATDEIILGGLPYNYDYRLCCTDFSLSDEIDCNKLGSSATPFVRLSSGTNAHVASPSYTEYPKLICIDGAVSCEVVDASACTDTQEVAVYSFSTDNVFNLHMNPFMTTPGTTKTVCCSIDSGQDTAEWRSLVNTPISNAGINDYVALTLSGGNGGDVTYVVKDNSNGAIVTTMVDDNASVTNSFFIWKIPSNLGGKNLSFTATPQGGSLINSNNLIVNATEHNTNPTTLIEAPADGSIYLINRNVAFDQQSSDEDDLMTGTWNFGDGTTIGMTYAEIVAGTIKQHSYSISGRKNVNFKITDSRELMADDNVTIHILGEGINVIANISTPSDQEKVLQAEGIVDFNAAGTYVVNVVGVDSASPTITCLAGACPTQTSDGVTISGGVQGLDKSFLNFTWRFSGAQSGTIGIPATVSKKGTESGAFQFTEDFLLGIYRVNLSVKHDSGLSDSQTNTFDVICTSGGCTPCIGDGCDTDIVECAEYDEDDCENAVDRIGTQNGCYGYFYCSWDEDDEVCEGDGVFEPESYCNEIVGQCTTNIVDTSVCENGEVTVTYSYSWSGLANNRPLSCPSNQETRVIPCPENVELPFFSLFNLVLTISLLSVIYTVLILRRRI